MHETRNDAIVRRMHEHSDQIGPELGWGSQPTSGFDFERTLEMDPHFLDDGDDDHLHHEHDDSVGGISCTGPPSTSTSRPSNSKRHTQEEI